MKPEVSQSEVEFWSQESSDKGRNWSDYAQSVSAEGAVQTTLDLVRTSETKHFRAIMRVTCVLSPLPYCRAHCRATG